MSNETFTEEDTRDKKHCTQDNDASVPFKIGTLRPHTVLPRAISCPVVFSWISSTVWNLFPFKGDFSFWKNQQLQGTKSGLWGADSPGWFDVAPKICGRHGHEWAGCPDEAANHQLSIAAAFWIIWRVSMEESSSFMQNLMQIFCSTCSVILNVTATQVTCSLYSVYCPQWLVQWSCHFLHMHIPVHSLRVPGYIDVMPTTLIISTMLRLFLGRPHISHFIDVEFWRKIDMVAYWESQPESNITCSTT